MSISIYHISIIIYYYLFVCLFAYKIWQEHQTMGNQMFQTVSFLGMLLSTNPYIGWDGKIYVKPD